MLADSCRREFGPELKPSFCVASAKQSAGTPNIRAPPPAQDDDSGGFVFKKEVEEVILHATVVDDQNHLITGSARENFKVYEDGKPQELTSFRKERVPVALGILIDNSGSMLPKRAKVNEAALQLVDASQREDRVFVVNFGEDAFLDQDYTQDVGKLKAALQRVETRGSTALYDAIIGAVDHLNKTSPLQKKVLLVVTDGQDNASQATFQEVLHKLQSKNGPVLYTIALEQNQRRDDSNRQSLRTLSEQTGGTAFFPFESRRGPIDRKRDCARHSESIHNRLPLFEFTRSGNLPLDSGSGTRRIRSTARRNPHRILLRKSRERGLALKSVLTYMS